MHTAAQWITGGVAMNKTARLVLKIIAASLALAAVVCFIVGSWSDVSERCKRLGRKSEYDDYEDEKLYD